MVKQQLFSSLYLIVALIPAFWDIKVTRINRKKNGIKTPTILQSTPQPPTVASRVTPLEFDDVIPGMQAQFPYV